MPAIRKSTRSYAGRQVDLELLKHVEDPADFVKLRRVHPTASMEPRIVSGIEKVVQRYANIFLTKIGSVKLDGKVGNELLDSIARGMVSNQSRLDHLAAVANSSTVRAMKVDDGKPDIYGPSPPDERIEHAEIVKAELIYNVLTGGRVHVHVKLFTEAGEDFVFIVPVAAGVS